MNRIIGLIIMDGFGLCGAGEGNAVKRQGTPELDKLMSAYAHTSIGACGLDVGLPSGQMGNSEVGHLNIGAGRVVYQDITMIDKSIADGDFFDNSAFVAAIENAKRNKTALHLFGLLSDGGVHSSIEHLFALLKMAKAHELSEVFVHCLMDGRDVSPTSGAGYVRQVIERCTETGVGKIASVMGRYYLMDRDNRWERVEKGFNCMMAGQGRQATDPVAVLEQSYASGITDEFIEPTSITYNGVYRGVCPNDSLIFFNFRSDRAREVSRAFIQRDFEFFRRAKGYMPLCYVGMTQYDATFTGLLTAYPPKNLKNTLGEYISRLGYRQLRIAETEKYAHVTFFFNGGVEQPNPNEIRALVPSPKVATYDLCPEMSAYEVAEQAIAQIQSSNIDVMILNFANCDMVGHTGNIAAAQKAVATVDECVGRVTGEILKAGGACLITADHGNAEQMLYDDGSVCTAHTTNPVPLILADDMRKKVGLIDDGKLCDIAPTMLELMGEPIPPEMEGRSLIKK